MYCIQSQMNFYYAGIERLHFKDNFKASFDGYSAAIKYDSIWSLSLNINNDRVVIFYGSCVGTYHVLPAAKGLDGISDGGGLRTDSVDHLFLVS